jgi:hypothetical protein
LGDLQKRGCLQRLGRRGACLLNLAQGEQFVVHPGKLLRQGVAAGLGPRQGVLHLGHAGGFQARALRLRRLDGAKLLPGPGQLMPGVVAPRPFLLPGVLQFGDLGLGHADVARVKILKNAVFVLQARQLAGGVLAPLLLLLQGVLHLGHAGGIGGRALRLRRLKGAVLLPQACQLPRGRFIPLPLLLKRLLHLAHAGGVGGRALRDPGLEAAMLLLEPCQLLRDRFAPLPFLPQRPLKLGCLGVGKSRLAPAAFLEAAIFLLERGQLLRDGAVLRLLPRQGRLQVERRGGVLRRAGIRSRRDPIIPLDAESLQGMEQFGVVKAIDEHDGEGAHLDGGVELVLRRFQVALPDGGFELRGKLPALRGGQQNRQQIRQILGAFRADGVAAHRLHGRRNMECPVGRESRTEERGADGRCGEQLGCCGEKGGVTSSTHVGLPLLASGC